MAYFWNEEKNESLKNERGISFEKVVIAIEEGHLIDSLENPNKTKYPGQRILVVEIDGYAICVPCVKDSSGDFFLKTLFPSRKYTKDYKIGGRHD